MKKYVIFFILVILGIFSSASYSFDNTDKQALLDILKSDAIEIQNSLVNNLERYNRWWSLLSPRERKISYLVDRAEEKYKLLNSDMPIPVSYSNVTYIAKLIGARSNSDVLVIEERMKQHVANYEDTKNLKVFEDNYNKAIKKIQDMPESK